MVFSTQIPLDFQTMPSYASSRFVCGEANRQAYQWIVSWPDWPDDIRMLNIFGPKASGKTHLSYLLPDDRSIRIPADIDSWLIDEFQPLIEQNTDQPLIFICDLPLQNITDNEENYFHIFNQIKNSIHFLLYLSDAPVTQMAIELADLRSRMRAMSVQEIFLPDDALLGAVLVKLATDRQLLLSEDMVKLIIANIERSFDAMKTLIDRLDNLTLETKKPVSLHLIRQLLSD